MCIILFSLGLIFEGWTNFINSEIWITKGLFTTIILLIIGCFSIYDDFM